MAALDILLLIALLTVAAPIASASDPDILTDFVVPQNLSSTIIDGNFFTYTGLRFLMGDNTSIYTGLRFLMGDNTPEPTSFTVLKASASEFPALVGQSVSLAVLIFPPGSVNPPHTHPRSAELLFLIGGTLDVGFVDTKNKLFTQTLQPGDSFVFPKGLVHFQYYKGNESAVAVSSFGSASAGTVSIPGTVFGAGIDDEVLAKSFKTDVATVKKIKSGLVPKA